MSLHFHINEDKAVEVLAYIASKLPGASEAHVAKVLFYAEKEHLNRYARPIVADTYIAMQWGPVPSRIRDILHANPFLPQSLLDRAALRVDVRKNARGYLEIHPRGEPNTEVFSKSDLECLDRAIAEFGHRSFDELTHLTHQERAYLDAERNREIDYELLVDEDNPDRARILEQAQEYAEFGIL